MEQSLIDRQRDAVIAFREAGRQRTAVEAQANTAHEVGGRACEATLKDIVEGATKIAEEARRRPSNAPTLLAEARLEGVWMRPAPAVAPAAGGRPAAELAAAAKAVEDTYSALRSHVWELAELRAARAQRRKAIFWIVIVGLILAVAFIYSGKREGRSNELYVAAQDALAQGRWSEAQARLDELSKFNAGYKDSAVLRRESYYRPAVAALRANHFTDAHPLLEQLLKIDPTDDDARALLLESYFDAGSAALQAGDWPAARAELEPLLLIDPTYKDAAEMYLESYYRAAEAAVASGRWADAKSDLEALLNIKPGYKDAQDLLKRARLGKPVAPRPTAKPSPTTVPIARPAPGRSFALGTAVEVVSGGGGVGLMLESAGKDGCPGQGLILSIFHPRDSTVGIAVKVNAETGRVLGGAVPENECYRVGQGYQIFKVGNNETRRTGYRVDAAATWVTVSVSANGDVLKEVTWKLR